MSNKVFKVLGNKEHKIDIAGKFALEFNIDPNKRKKFRLTNLLSEIPTNSKDQERNFFVDINNRKILSYYVSKLKTVLDPDRSVVDSHNISVLIDHSDVRIDSMTPEEHQSLVQRGIKRSNPRFTLYSLDKRKNESLSAEKLIVKAQSLIFDSKYSSKQLCYLCATFEIPYRLEESMEGAKRDSLEDKLSKFIKASSSNAEKLINQVEDLKQAENIFYLDQMLRLELLIQKDGFYKLSSDPKPIGIDRKTVFAYFENNIENFNYLKSEVQRLLKEEVENK